MYHILREFIDFLNSISCTYARYLCIIMTTGVNKQLLLIFFSATSIISPPLMLIFKCYSASHGRIQTNPPSQKKFLIRACQAHVLTFNTRLQGGPRHVCGKFSTDVNLRKNFPGVDPSPLPRFTGACINIHCTTDHIYISI